MSNYIIVNGKTVLSSPKPLDEAEETLKSLSMIYPKAELQATDEAVVKPKRVFDTKPEIVEDSGCVGGGCTL